jgi:hypothetical protein
VIYPDLYVIDWAWDRMGFVKSKEEIKRLHAKWSGYERGHISKVCIEDRANGSAVIEVLKKEIPGVFPIQPLGSKEARIEAASAVPAVRQRLDAGPAPAAGRLRAREHHVPEGEPRRQHRRPGLRRSSSACRATTWVSSRRS